MYNIYIHETAPARERPRDLKKEGKGRKIRYVITDTYMISDIPVHKRKHD